MASFSELGSQLLSQGLGGQQQHSLLENVLGLLNHPGVGGISGLADRFRAGGLGHIVDGWIGKGPNPAVTPGQLQQVLGSDQLNAFAQRTGLPLGEATQHLADLLPHVVDHLTPDGAVPKSGFDASSVLGALKSRIFGG